MSATKKLTQLAIVAGMLSSLVACTNEDLMYNPQLEAYTRAFIKEFGKIDPQQDWNMAQDANVVIDLGNRIAQSVKVYAKVEDTYYLIADLVNLTGEINVPVDIPQTSSDILVRVDDNDYFGTISGVIDCTGESRKSRQLVNNTSASGGEYNVTASLLDWEYFNAQQMSPITSTENWPSYYSTSGKAWRYNPNTFTFDNLRIGWGIVPENGTLNTAYNGWPNGGLAEGTFNNDFIIYAQEGYFDIYPYYTGTNKKHTLGIYFVDDTGNALELDDNDHPIIYPIFEDSSRDDLQIAIRPLMNVKDIKGIEVYNYRSVDENNNPIEADSYNTIGDKIGEISRDGTSKSWDSSSNSLTSETFTLEKDHIYWIFPIVEREDGSIVTLERMQETTTLPRYELDWNIWNDDTNLDKTSGQDQGYYSSYMTISKRGLV